MRLERLWLYNFRSYQERKFEFSSEVTVITGKNGTGKTNILEAIYVLLQGRSFRDSDEQLLRYDAEWWKINGVFDSFEREIRYQPEQPVAKQLNIDGVRKGRFTYKQQVPVVLFEPDHLMLIHGSPSRRRAYLDTLLSALSPTYRSTLSKYERALQQRNNLLKKGLPYNQLKDAVFVWDVALSEYGAEIQASRERLMETLNNNLCGYYSALAVSEQALAVVYEPTSRGGAHVLAHLLSRSLEKDVMKGFTSVGPHRDNIWFLLNGKDAKITASRGEIRSIVLALKYAEIAELGANSPTMPLLLLDDVFSELDAERQKALLVNTNGIQKIITSTHAIIGVKKMIGLVD